MLAPQEFNRQRLLADRTLFNDLLEFPPRTPRIPVGFDQYNTVVAIVVQRQIQDGLVVKRPRRVGW